MRRAGEAMAHQKRLAVQPGDHGDVVRHHLRAHGQEVAAGKQIEVLERATPLLAFGERRQQALLVAPVDVFGLLLALRQKIVRAHVQLPQ